METVRADISAAAREVLFFPLRCSLLEPNLGVLLIRPNSVPIIGGITLTLGPPLPPLNMMLGSSCNLESGSSHWSSLPPLFSAQCSHSGTTLTIYIELWRNYSHG